MPQVASRTVAAKFDLEKLRTGFLRVAQRRVRR
jgi:hypothetical protein